MDTDYIKMMYQYDLLYGNGKTHVEMAFNGKTYLDLDFQEGAVKEDKDINGCTIEDLLVLAHARLNYYQGTLPDYHNEMALRHIEEALLDLSSRMTARYLSTVESTNKSVDYKTLTPSKVMEESKKSPIISKLAHLEIASEDYTEGDKKHFTWDEAMKIGEKIGDGWRLPTRHEWALICEEFGQKDGKLDSDTLIKNIGVGSHGGLNANGLYNAGLNGLYWSATPHSNGNNAYYLNFNSGNLYPSSSVSRYFGYSVRLVKDLEEIK